MQNKTKGLFFPSLFFFPLLLFLFSCAHSGRKKPQVPQAKLPKVQVHIRQYGKALFEADTTHLLDELIRLQHRFPLFLNGNLHDTANYNQLHSYVTDTQIIRIYHETMAVYPQLNSIEKQLSSALSHVKYYFPTFRIPHFYTYVSDLSYEQPIIQNDSVIVIALDDYLGKNYSGYAALEIPRYKTRCMSANNITIDVLKTIYANNFYQDHRMRTLLDKMVEHGKQLYFLDLAIPNVPDSLKIGYTTKQLNWMEQHKQDAWASLIANKLLYTTNFKAIRELTEEGPFTKGFGNKSAPAVATWFGWQIVSAYMNRFPKTTPQQLFHITDSQKMLEKSRYKP